ncbi:hypothetical protein D3C75_609200 [compost metagenome]
MLILKSYHLVRLTNYIAYLIDKGEKISVERLLDLLKSGSLISEFEKNYADLDMSIFDEVVQKEICDCLWDEYYGSSSSPSDYGVIYNGLCYLIILISGYTYRFLESR